MVYLQLLFLLLVANGAPIVARWIFRDRWDFPIDGGAKFFDGRPIFGASKTYRGVFSSCVTTTLAASLLGFPFQVGLLIGLYAMVGDGLSSFLKRRLGMVSGAKALGVDQIPESALPLFGLWSSLNLTFAGIVVTVCLFFALELGLSVILFRFHLRKHPY